MLASKKPPPEYRQWQPRRSTEIEWSGCGYTCYSSVIHHIYIQTSVTSLVFSHDHCYADDTTATIVLEKTFKLWSGIWLDSLGQNLKLQYKSWNMSQTSVIAHRIKNFDIQIFLNHQIIITKYDNTPQCI